RRRGRHPSAPLRRERRRDLPAGAIPMKRHSPDIAALVFGVAFAITGALVVVTQATRVDVGPPWGLAVVAIAVGTVILLATLVRSRREPVEVPASAPTSESVDDLGDG